MASSRAPLGGAHPRACPPLPRVHAGGASPPRKASGAWRHAGPKGVIVRENRAPGVAQRETPSRGPTRGTLRSLSRKCAAGGLSTGCVLRWGVPTELCWSGGEAYNCPSRRIKRVRNSTRVDFASPWRGATPHRWVAPAVLGLRPAADKGRTQGGPRARYRLGRAPDVEAAHEVVELAPECEWMWL